MKTVVTVALVAVPELLCAAVGDVVEVQCLLGVRELMRVVEMTATHARLESCAT